MNNKLRWGILIAGAVIVGLTIGKGVMNWMIITGTPPPPIQMKTLYVVICPTSGVDFGDFMNKAYEKNKNFGGIVELDICQGDFTSYIPIVLSGVTTVMGSGSGTITSYVNNNSAAIYLTGKGLVRIKNVNENIWVPTKSSIGYWVDIEGNSVFGEAANDSIDREVMPSYPQYSPVTKE